jgi:hypothetical protein
MDLTDWEDIHDTVKRVSIAASVGDNTLVAAVSGKRIVVVQCALYSDADAVIRFESGAGGAALTGQMQLFAKAGTALDPGAATGDMTLPFSPAGWFETGVNTLLNLEVSGAAVNGVLGYIEN